MEREKRDFNVPTDSCSNCGSDELYATAAPTPAGGLFGPNLLPNLPAGRFEVVVCGECGLTTLFARRIDVQSLRARGWVKVVEPVRPLGLADDQ